VRLAPGWNYRDVEPNPGRRRGGVRGRGGAGLRRPGALGRAGWELAGMPTHTPSSRALRADPLSFVWPISVLVSQLLLLQP
jgi:hypothetical protein